MAEKIINWADHDDTNVTLSYNGTTGDQVVTVTAGVNDFTAEKTVTVKFKTTDNALTRPVTITQEALPFETLSINTALADPLWIYEDDDTPQSQKTAYELPIYFITV